jgi:putative transposase
MVSLAERKRTVEFLRQDFELSERRACALVGQSLSTQRYVSRRMEIPGLRKRLIDLAHERIRFGYPRLHYLLRREGFAVNRKRVYRLYREEGLKLRRKRRKQISGLRRMPMTPALAPNERWSIDFVSDALSSGRRFRVLNIVDDYSKLSPAIEVDTSLPGLRVIRTLERAIELRGKPKLIVMDNGPEFTCRALDEWAWSRGIALHWIDPGKPMQNAFVESFNGRFREECLDQHHFVSLDDARALIEGWREDYNTVRPHTSLRGLSPEEFLRASSEGSPSDAAPTSAQSHLNPSTHELVGRT